MIVTAGTVHDAGKAEALIEGFDPDTLIADRAYDTNALLDLIGERKITPVIPPKRSRKVERDYDRDLYQLRHLIENAFLKLKRWRGVATRYAKTTASFLAECQIAAIMLYQRHLGMTDTGPLSGADGGDGFGSGDEPVPGGASGFEDVGVGLEDAI